VAGSTVVARLSRFADLPVVAVDQALPNVGRSVKPLAVPAILVQRRDVFPLLAILAVDDDRGILECGVRVALQDPADDLDRFAGAFDRPADAHDIAVHGVVAGLSDKAHARLVRVVRRVLSQNEKLGGLDRRPQQDLFEEDVFLMEVLVDLESLALAHGLPPSTQPGPERHLPMLPTADRKVRRAPASSLSSSRPPLDRSSPIIGAPIAW
jgi:hypothetical protein